MSGEAVLVTGAAGGVGEAVCVEFESRGYFVVATDLPGSTAASQAFLPADLRKLCSDADSRRKLRNRVNDLVGKRPLKALINNAAVQHLARLDDLNADAARESLDVNVLAPMLLSQLFLPELEASQGSIINIGSIHSRLTKPGFACYATTKSALEGMTRGMAVDLGARVRVNLIQPGAVDTRMLREGFADDVEAFHRLRACQPLDRIAAPSEIASAAAFLVSDDARFITGAVIPVDGGIGARLHDPQ